MANGWIVEGAYPAVFGEDFGVHVPDEHVECPLPFLRENGRVECRLLTVDYCAGQCQ